MMGVVLLRSGVIVGTMLALLERHAHTLIVMVVHHYGRQQHHEGCHPCAEYGEPVCHYGRKVT